jgi:hypothetical protein
MVKWLLFFLLLPLTLFSIDTVSINATLDSGSLNQGWPINGTLEITHDQNQKVDEGSVVLDGQPLKISLQRNVQIDPSNPLMVSIYNFSIPAKQQGAYTLNPISLKIGDKTYKTYPVSYTVQAPINLPQPSPSTAGESTNNASLKLEAFIQGPKELYPGQVTTLVYRYIYQGSIALSKEELPMLEADGVQMMGRKDIQNLAEGNSSIFQVSQKVQALKPGDYSWGPSIVEGTVYLEDAVGNKQFTSTILKSEAPAVKIQVKPFPEKNKPAPFTGAFGKFSVEAKLTTPAQISVGDPINLQIEIKGETTNWDAVTLPVICCQPGFGGFFKFSDLPPVGKKQEGSKIYSVDMNPISSAVKAVPVIQFSFFEPESGTYKTVTTQTIPLQVSPGQQVALNDQTQLPALEKSLDTASDWIRYYRKSTSTTPLDLNRLKPIDLLNWPIGRYWVLWLIPFGILAFIFQTQLKKKWEKESNKVKAITSKDLYRQLLNQKTGSSSYFQLLHQTLRLALEEKMQKKEEDESLLKLKQDVLNFLSGLDEKRYSKKIVSDKQIYEKQNATAQELFKKLGLV